MLDAMLTTVDNPYDPFTQYDDWYKWDIQAGYDTCGYLDRVSYSSHELSETDQDEAIAMAMEEIVLLNINGRYKMVFREEN